MQCMKRYYSGRTTKFFIGRIYAADNAIDDIGLANVVDAMDVGLGKSCMVCWLYGTRKVHRIEIRLEI